MRKAAVASDRIGYVCTEPKHLRAPSEGGYTTINEGVWAWCPVGCPLPGHHWNEITMPMSIEMARHAWRSGRLRPTASPAGDLRPARS